MSKWRAKRQLISHKQIMESAESALLALSILRARDHEVDLDYSDEVIEKGLSDGKVLIENVADAINNEQLNDVEYLSIAQDILEKSSSPPSRIARKYRQHVSTIEDVETKLEYDDDLEEVEDILENILQIASTESQNKLNQVDSLAHGIDR